MISVIFHLDEDPHEVIIKDTKYYVKELYSCDKKKNEVLTVIIILYNINSAGICLLGQRLMFLENPLS